MSRAESLFIADLHLSAGRVTTLRRFVRFIEQRAVQAEALYILGDLFDAWVGDDDFTPPNGLIVRALQRLSAQGTRIYLQHGNRDFLIGARFAKAAGLEILPDHAVIDLYGTPTLLCHGDSLCSDDVAYQQFRRKSRDPAWRTDILAKPLLLRLLAARWYRLRSFWHKSKQSAVIMDVNADTLKQTVREYGVSRLIHGHTHRPCLNTFTLDGQCVQRYVLAPWEEQGSVLCCNASGVRVERVV